jgi:hypothetical protein
MATVDGEAEPVDMDVCTVALVIDMQPSLDLSALKNEVITAGAHALCPVKVVPVLPTGTKDGYAAAYPPKLIAAAEVFAREDSFPMRSSAAVLTLSL